MRKLVVYFIVFFLSLFGALGQQNSKNLFPQKNEDGLWGYVNEKNEVIVPYKYKFVHPFNGNLAWALDEKSYFILSLDINGNISSVSSDININNCQPYMFSEGISKVYDKVKKEDFYVNKNGEKSHVYIEGTTFRNGYSRVYTTSILSTKKYVPAIISKDFSSRTFINHTFIPSVSDNIVSLFDADSRSYGYADNITGKIFPDKYITASKFNNGKALVATVDQRMVYTIKQIDKTGKVLADFPLTSDDFPETRGSAHMLIRSLETKKLNYALAPDFNKITITYDTIDMFNDGYAIVRKNGKQGLINENFEEVISPQFEQITNDGIYGRLYIINNKAGIINLETKKVHPAKYSKISSFGDFGDRWCYVYDGEFYVDINGNEYKGKPKLSALEKAEKFESEKYSSPFSQPLSNDLGKEIWDKTTYNSVRIDSMIKLGVDINKPVTWSKGSNDLPLLVAIKQRNMWMFNHFIRLGADVTKLNYKSITDKVGTPIHYDLLYEMSWCNHNGCKNDYYEMLETLLKTNNKNINEQFFNEKTTLLHQAMKQKLDIKVFELLLKYGADKTIKNSNGQTVYDYLKMMKRSLVEWKGEEYVNTLLTLLKPEAKK